VGALGRLLEAVEANAVPTPALLLLEAADRFGRRPPFEALQTILGRCLEHGLDLLMLDRNLHVTREKVNSDPSVLIRLALELDTAHGNSERLSRRMLQAHEQGRKRQANGEISRAGWAPEWIDLVDANGNVIPSDASREGKSAGVAWRLNGKAAVVQRVIELAEAGLGQTAIGQRLNDDGIPPLRGAKSKASRSGSVRSVWNPGQVAHLLSSPSVAGGRELKRRTGEITWDYYPAVIPRPRWEALRLKLAKRAPNQLGGKQDKIKFLGQGCTTCASCGRPMGYRMSSHHTAAGKVSKEYVRCRGRTSGVCDQPSIRMEQVVAHILTRLSLDQLGQLFPSRDDDGSAALKVQLRLLEQDRDQARAMAMAAEQEVTKALATEPALAAVLGRQVVMHEQRAAELDQQCQALAHQLDSQQSDHEVAAITDLGNRVGELLKKFSKANSPDDLEEERRAVNALMRKLCIRVVIDAEGQQIGMAAGPAAELDWHPLSRLARSLALAEGIVDPASAWDRPGVGSAVITRTGETVFVADPNPPAGDQTDLLQKGYEEGKAQALVDIRRLAGAKKGKQGWGQEIEEHKIVLREDGDA
jgi:hypothetical protein